MRFGYCANLNFYLKGDEVSKAIFDSVLASGYDYIETPLSAYLLLSDEQRKDLALRLADANTPCRANFLLFPHELPLVGEALNLEAVREHAKRVLPIAREIGSEVVVFGNGGSRRVREGMDAAAVRAQLAEVLKAVAPIAKQNGVRIAIEPLCSKETNMINSYAEGAALAREAGSEWIGTVCDWYHVATDNQNPSEINAAQDKLFHLHIAYPDGRTVPSAGDDASKYTAFVNAVKGAGYDGTLSIEAVIKDEIGRIPAIIEGGLAAVRALFQ